MKLRPLLRRLVLPPLAAGLAVAGLALPARAESLFDFPLLLVEITDTVTVIDGQSKTVTFEVENLGGGAAKDAVVRFRNVPAALGFVPPAGCSPTECKLAELPAGERKSFTFTVKPDAGSALTSSLEVGVVDDLVSMGYNKVRVVRTTKSGVDLEVGALKDLKIGRGNSATQPVVIRNTGNAKSATLGLLMAAQDGVEPDMDGYRNCEQDEDAGGVVCVIDRTLAPGETVAVSPRTPVTFKVKSDTPGPAKYFAGVAAVGLTDKYVAAFTKRNASKTGAELTVTTTASTAGLTDGDVGDDLNPDDNAAIFYVTTPMAPADSEALGAVFRGAEGDRATAKVGSRNLGPFAKAPLSLTSLEYLHVKLPTGIKLTEVPDGCLPGTSLTEVNLEGTLASRDWVCLVFDQLPKGGKGLFSFTGTIGDGSHDAGFVQVGGSAQDTVKSNDRAALTVTVEDSLPITGPSAGLIAGGGAVIVIVGFLVFRAARRRRIVLVA